VQRPNGIAISTPGRCPRPDARGDGLSGLRAGSRRAGLVLIQLLAGSFFSCGQSSPTAPTAARSSQGLAGAVRKIKIVRKPKDRRGIAVVSRRCMIERIIVWTNRC